MATKKKFPIVWVIIGSVVLLAVVGAMFAKGSKPKGEKVTVENVKKRTIRETVSASGKVYPEFEVKISSDVSGEIVELYIKEGDSVRAGQLLARIDPDSYESAVERGIAGVNTSKAQVSNAKAQENGIRSQIAQAKAQKEQVEAQLENTRANHKRNEKLHKEGVISDLDFEASLSALRTAEANYRSAVAGIEAAESNLEGAKQSSKAAEFGVRNSEASLKELNTSLRRTSIYSPRDGIVSRLSVEKGERVVGTIQMSGTEMMRIADLSKMEVQVDVNENEVTKLSLGDEAEVEIDAYIGKKFKGTVSEIANTASNAFGATGQVVLSSDQATNFVVKIRLEPSSYAELISKERPHPFRPGMSASVDIFSQTIEEALSVPIAAVTTREEKEEEVVNKNVPQEEKAIKATDKQEDLLDDIKEVVFVAVGDSVKMVEVTSGIQDDDFIQILSGLTEKDKVVTGPYTAVSRNLKQGAKITVVKEEELNKKSGS